MEPSQQMMKGPRIGGLVLIIASAIMFVGAAIPFIAPSLNQAPWTDDPNQLAVAIAGNPTAWRWANGLILAAAIITALGLVPISVSFRGNSRLWAVTALLAFSMAAVFEAVDRMISINIFSWAAESGLDPMNSAVQGFILLDSALGGWFAILSFVALGLYGMAMVYQWDAKTIGWVFVASGLFGLVLQLIGAAIPGFVFLGTGAFGVVILLGGSTFDV